MQRLCGRRVPGAFEELLGGQGNQSRGAGEQQSRGQTGVRCPARVTMGLVRCGEHPDLDGTGPRSPGSRSSAEPAWDPWTYASQACPWSGPARHGLLGSPRPHRAVEPRKCGPPNSEAPCIKYIPYSDDEVHTKNVKYLTNNVLYWLCFEMTIFGVCIYYY